ncbi:MAG: type II secretion system F family protein [Bryobacterales bacterium]|nr:type II secretion system F family protein [Bryobacterales bacterium]
MPVMIFVIFGVLVLVVFGVTMVGVTVVERQRQKKVVGMLNTLQGKSVAKAAVKKTSIERQLPADSQIERLAAKLKPMNAVQSFIQQSGLQWTSAQFLGMTVGCALGGAIVSLYVAKILPLSTRMPVFALAASAIPFAILRFKASRRMAAFEEQFPDALDFLARSMKAGNAFSVSLEMLGKEAQDPLGMEVRRVYSEQNLGSSLDDSLRNLCSRVPLLDVRFFVSSVLLQKDTGGNLSEILSNLAYIIRERFKLKGMVKAVSASGRMTAWVLIGLPIGLAVGLSFLAPGYLDALVNDPEGKLIIIFVCVAQVIGYFVMRKIINIRV